MAEADLVALARNGDLAAFNALVEAHQALVFGVCLRLLRERPAAEDAAQEAFVAAWRGLPGLRGAFRPWLLRIAANACTDELRRRLRRPASSLETAMEAGVPEPPDEDPSPEDSALDSELRDRLTAALGALVEDQRVAIVLCDVDGLDYAEIATVTRVSLGTVKSRIARGRARLRELLQADAELLPARFRQQE